MDTDVHLDLLDRIEIAAPCPMRWEDLDGDGPVRHCSRCDLDVHDLSAMSRAQVARLVASREGRLCATFFRRADGTILTRNCPVGLAALRARTARTLGRVAAALALQLTGSAVLGATRSQRLRACEPFRTVCRWLAPAPAPPPLTLTPRPPSRLLGRITVKPPAGGNATGRPAPASSGG